ncbi:3216_t:CDS:2 [Dentiscutata heterogama]|uniref:3216_t:CDS:1 n=1 Tax=Dentiscutata heterogama TaxID=1316150 RepID=A0ACA9MGM5_9GLOM|nr:3216_t:CDS:2 [Dentiscutata heterogama]
MFSNNKITKKNSKKAIKRKKDSIAGLIDDIYAHSVINDYKRLIEDLRLNKIDAKSKKQDLKQAFVAKKNEYDKKIKRR